MFYLRLARERVRRLSQKYRDARDATGSRRAALFFVLQFCRLRSGYLFRHLLARLHMRGIRAGLGAVRPPDRPFLAVKVTGGIGDYIVIARYLRDLAAHVEPFVFDIYCSNTEAAGWIFAPVPGFREAYSEFMFEDLLPDYDIGLWIMQAIVIYRRTAAWHRLRASRRLCAALQKVADFRPRIEPFLGRHPMMDNFLAQRAVYMNFTRASFLQGMTGIAAGGDMLDLAVDESILPSAGLRSGHYLTIHNGFDPAMVVAGLAGTMATKCYPRFAEVARHIKAALPDLPLVQIGAVATSTAIEGVDQSLVGAATLPQTAALLKHAVWHIDNEGGLVHLARCFGTRCTVVFGPTPLDFFGYAANINIPPAACGGCWWITETWMARCPRGHLAPLCTQQDPLIIARATLEAMRPFSGLVAAGSNVAGA